MVRSHSLYPVELRGPWDHSTAEILADHQINVSIWFAASESETLNTLCVAYRASRLNFRPCVGQLRQSERRAQSAPGPLSRHQRRHHAALTPPVARRNVEQFESRAPGSQAAVLSPRESSAVPSRPRAARATGWDLDHLIVVLILGASRFQGRRGIGHLVNNVHLAFFVQLANLCKLFFGGGRIPHLFVNPP